MASRQGLERLRDARQVDRDIGVGGGDERRRGQPEAIGRDEVGRIPGLRDREQPVRVGERVSVGRSRGDGLHDPGVDAMALERRGDRRCDDRLADAGVGAGDEDAAWLLHGGAQVGVIRLSRVKTWPDTSGMAASDTTNDATASMLVPWPKTVLNGWGVVSS